MEFQSLFVYTRELLKALPSIKWVDLDKGQLERYTIRPQVAFPCALISANITRAKNRNHTQQECEATIVVRLAFDYTGETSAAVDDDLLEESLAYFRVSDEVYKGMQGKTNGNAAPFVRVSEIEEASRADGLKVLRLTFTTAFFDNSAKPQA